MDHTCSKIPSDLTLCLRGRGRGREREGREGGRGLDLLLLTLCRVICPQPPYFLAGFWGSFTFLSRLQNTSETSPVRKGGVHRGEGKRISQTPSALLISAFLIEVHGFRDFLPGAMLMSNIQLAVDVHVQSQWCTVSALCRTFKLLLTKLQKKTKTQRLSRCTCFCARGHCHCETRESCPNC